MKQKRSHDERVIERKQRVVNQPSYTAQSRGTDALDTASLATDADVQGVFTTVCAPKSKADPYRDQHSLHNKGGRQRRERQ